MRFTKDGKAIAKYLTISTCTVNMFLDPEDNPAIKIKDKRPSQEREIFVYALFKIAGKRNTYVNQAC